MLADIWCIIKGVWSYKLAITGKCVQPSGGILICLLLLGALWCMLVAPRMCVPLLVSALMLLLQERLLGSWIQIQKRRLD